MLCRHASACGGMRRHAQAYGDKLCCFMLCWVVLCRYTPVYRGTGRYTTVCRRMAMEEKREGMGDDSIIMRTCVRVKG